MHKSGSKLPIFFLLLFCSSVFASAQSNKIIDDLLNETTASYGNIAYLVLSAAEIIPEDADEERAMSELTVQGWNTKNKGIYNAVSLGEFSYILMEAFNIKGGIMYTIFPSPRYASRELGFKGYIKSDTGAYRNVAGREAMQILGRVIRDREQS